MSGGVVAQGAATTNPDPRGRRTTVVSRIADLLPCPQLDPG
jgi:hypothetical protein